MKRKFAVVLVAITLRGVLLGVNTYTGFNTVEDGAHYSLGNIAGKGSATNDWAGAWIAAISTSQPGFSFNVITGGSQGGAGDQSLAMVGSTSSGHNLTRPMVPWSGNFEWSFDVKLNSTVLGATCQQQLEGGPAGVGSARPLNIKWENGGNFKINDTVLMSNYGAPTAGFVSMTSGEWVSVKIVCAWSNTPAFELYWERTDGSLGYVGSVSNWKDTWSISSQVGTFKVNAPKSADMWIDNVRFSLPTYTNARNPSPASGVTSTTTNLSWLAGQNALSHDVYFGTNQSEVTSAQRLPGDINGDGPSEVLDLSIVAGQWLTNPGAANPSADVALSGKVDFGDFAVLGMDWHKTPSPVFRGNQTGTTYNPGTLVNGTTYYWRIDEVSAGDPSSPIKGDVWHFVYTTNVPQTIAIMPLGDSITEGSYRYYLWNLLSNSGHNNINFVGSLYKMFNNSTVDSRVYDQNHEGHFGWRDDQIAASVYGWLQLNPPDIILLHTGTNGLEESPAHVASILDEIDRFERNYGGHIKVILARIINRNPYSALTTTFNNNVAAMAQNRINSGDDIIIVDMENGAGLNYSTDMYDDKHPNESGYQKMAHLWFTTLQSVLP